MWKGTVLMISLAGLGDAAAVGEVAGDGDPTGVGAVPGVVTAVGVVCVDGEVVAVWFCRVQPARTKTNPATYAAGTAPLLTTL
jgi:hypothetical protein